MSQEQQHINYSAADIERYFRGGMTTAEMHAMEKAALDDPFLAEAMEGYEAVRGTDWNRSLAALKEDFAGKAAPAKLVVMHQSRTNWWKAVAAILFIGTGTALTYFLTRQSANHENPGIATITTTPQQDAIKDSAAPPPAGNTAVITENGKETNAPANKPAAGNTRPESDKPILAKEETKGPAPTAAPTTPAPGDAASNEDRKQVQQEAIPAKTTRNLPAPVMNNNNVATNRSRADENVISNNSQEKDKELADKKPALSNASAAGKALTAVNSFNAQVLAADNTPLPFSNINVKTGNFETYADVKGNFRLVSADTVLTVEVKSLGYQPRTFTLRSSQPSHKLVLAPDEMAMANKTVVAAKRKAGSAPSVSRRAVLIKDSVVNVEPADGWDNYNTYIANNIELPDEILKGNTHGQIGISFDVDANGAISNIKIDPSRCSNCEALTRKLIEQGPQWKNKNGKATSAKFTVQF